ncbi:hypothetical protein ABK040_002352 [Willaertia magna]
MESKTYFRVKQILNHLIPDNPSSNNVNNNLNNINNQHFPKSVNMGVFRTIHTGIVNDPDASTFERKKPLRLELRKSYYEQGGTITSIESSSQNKSETTTTSTTSGNVNYPYTSILILDHVFHVAKLLLARHIHLKYVEQSGDTYIMFRTDQGLVPYSTIQNKHWIKFLLMHSTGKEEYEKAGEGEFRLEVMTERDGRLDFTVNLIYIQGGVKVTLSFINV